MPSKPKKLDAFTRAYIEAMLWSTNDNADEQGGEPFDKNYSADDIAPETMELIVEDCADFQRRYAELLADSGIDDARAGHDFWLSREGHGSGFFDEDSIDEEFRDPLQDAAREYGGFDLGLGDPDADGDVLIYGPPTDWYREHHPRGVAESRRRRHHRSATRPEEPTVRAFGREAAGEYHTRTGKVGAKIYRSVDRGGRVTYSYTGEWGAGSGHDLAHMQREIRNWFERKRGIQTIIPFTP